MITFEKNGVRFLCRAAGVMLYQEHVLPTMPTHITLADTNVTLKTARH